MSDRDDAPGPGGNRRLRSDERQRVEPFSDAVGPRDLTSHTGSQPMRVWRLLLAAALIGAIGFLALRTSPYLQYVPWMPRRVGVWADSNGIVRNVVAFVALGLAVFVLVGRGWRVALALAAFGAGVEVAQRWIPGRVFDWRDIAASVAGVLLAWIAVWPLRRRGQES